MVASLSEEPAPFIYLPGFKMEAVGSSWKMGNYLPDYSASQPRKL
jgi:hypothetical protein